MAPTNQISSPPKEQGPRAGLINEDCGHKGLCLYCGEIFNLRECYRKTDVCPECADLFDESAES